MLRSHGLHLACVTFDLSFFHFTSFFEIIPKPSLLWNDIIAEHCAVVNVSYIPMNKGPFYSSQLGYIFTDYLHSYIMIFSVRFMTFLVQNLIFVLFLLLVADLLHSLVKTPLPGLIFVTSKCAQRVHPVNDKFERLCLFSNCKLTGRDSEGLSCERRPV